MIAPPVASAASPVAANRTDSQIESDFRMRLNRSKLSGEGIQIHVKSAVATLTGKTGVIQHKGSATRMAKSAGARQVINQIEISAAARQAAAEKLSASVQHGVSASPRTSAPVSHPPAGTQSASQAPTAVVAPQTAPPPVRRAQIRH